MGVDDSVTNRSPDTLIRLPVRFNERGAKAEQIHPTADAEAEGGFREIDQLVGQATDIFYSPKGLITNPHKVLGDDCIGLIVGISGQRHTPRTA
jgi:hypothetical protein